VSTLVSAFAGIGGFELAGERVGFHTDTSCEIDAPARRVLSARFPDTLLHDDVTTLTHHELFYPEVDVLTAGSPCQDFSIAGLRGGLAGERSGLFDHVIRLRDELLPRFVVWENVPGALTSNKGEDFANVIGALVGSPEPLRLPRHPSGRMSRYAGIAHGPAGTLAWRVLDAQHFGVPQRRQRIFAVLDTQGWASIDALFPELPSDLDYGSRHGRPWVARGPAWACPLDYDDLPTGMDAGAHRKVRLAEILEQDVDERYYLSEKACKGILRRAEKRGRTLPEILDYALRSQAGEVVGEVVSVAPVEVTNALGASGVGTCGADDNQGQAGHLIPVAFRQLKFGVHVEDTLASRARTGDAKGRGDVVVEPLALSQNSRDEVRTSDIAPALSGGGGKPGQGYSALLEPTLAFNARQDPIVAEDLTAGPVDTDPYTHAVCAPPLYRVRRLTPTECERIQGFPDGWTAVEGAKDSQRYKQLGNAVAVPAAEWVLGRIAKVTV